MYTIDIETTGLNRFKDEITLIGVQREDKAKRIYEPRQHRLFVEDALRWKSEGERFLWQNGKFDTLWLQHKFGIRLPISEDTLLMGTAYDLAAEHSLKKMAQNYLGVPDWDISKKDKTSLSKSLKPYLKKDLQYTRELYDFFDKEMTDKERKVYRHLLLPAYRAYRNVEHKGIYIDRKALEEVAKRYEAEAARLLAQLKAAYDINWSSAAQVSKVLFEELGLPILERTPKGAPSCGAPVLKRLAKMENINDNNICALLVEYKEYFGAISKFFGSWREASSYDGRIHPSFNLTNVVTGRTSCSEPNLQQVPRRKELRTLYTAAPGRTLIEADYSQLELRVAADYAQEHNMIKIYREGGDIHTETARAVMGKTEVVKEERTKAKAVNFGFLYGMAWKKFKLYALNSYGTTVTESEAKHFREIYFMKYPRLLTWHKEQEELCRMQGGVYNRFGRFRALPDIYHSDKWKQLSAARRAINTPVQGTGSDLLLLSISELTKPLREHNAYIVCSVHDSILVDCPDKYVEPVCALIKRVMENPAGLKKFGVSFSVPIVADIAIGPWGS